MATGKIISYVEQSSCNFNGKGCIEVANVPLGTLERVPLRDAWPHEAVDFIPWLAQEDNMAVLGDELGMELALEAQEKDVGPFRADILARDVQSDQLVLIENQLDKTDHGHLGQLLTYAAVCRP